MAKVEFHKNLMMRLNNVSIIDNSGAVILLGSFVAMIAAVKRQVDDNSEEIQNEDDSS